MFFRCQKRKKCDIRKVFNNLVLVFTLLLMSLLAFTFTIQHVKASGTIYIRAEGSIDPETSPIQRKGDIYTFTDNIYDPIVVERNNIVIDGAGYTLQGMGSGYGFSLSGVSNVTIKNTKIIYFFDGGGVFLSSSSNNTITANNITDNGFGVLLGDSSNYNIIKANNITNNTVGYGVGIYHSSNYNIIETNSITNNSYCGVQLYGNSNHNIIAANNIARNHGDGIELSVSSNNNVTANKIVANTGNAITLSENSNYNSITANNITNNENCGVSVYSNYNNITANNIANSDIGIFFYYSSSYNTIASNNITDNNYNGIEIYKFSDYHSIVKNNITNNGRDGVSAISDYTNVTANNITNNNGNGIKLSGLSNNITANNIIANNGDGIALWGSSNIITVNNITTNNEDGILLEQNSEDNKITANNIVANNGVGIELYGSSNNITMNIIADNGVGILLSDSSNNNCSIVGNTFVGNGLVIPYPYDFVVVNNSVNGKPLVYLEDVSDAVVEDAGQVILVNCNGILVRNLNLSSATVGVQLFNTTSTTITNNNITNNERGIGFWKSSNNTIAVNNITDNGNGIELTGMPSYYSSNNIIIMNDITNNEYYGIWLDYYSSSSYIALNNITANNRCGIWLSGLSNNITMNNIANNGDGIALSGSSNIITVNNFTNNNYGIRLVLSSGNIFYHNNFENAQQAIFASSVYPNVWDNGYPSGGNYWSDYTGTDLYSGSEQNISGSDFVGDTPYIINENNIDRYPLIPGPRISILSPKNKSYPTEDVPLTFVVVIIFPVNGTTAWMGYSLDNQPNVTNTGNTTLTGLFDGPHNVVVYANDTFGKMGMSAVDFTVDTISPIVAIDPVTSPKDKFRLINRPKFNQTITGTFVEANIDRIVVNGRNAMLDKAAGTYSINASFFWGNNLINVTAFDLAGNTATAIFIYSPAGALFEEFGMWIGIVAVGIIFVPLPLALKRRRVVAPAVSAPNFEYVGVGSRFLAYLIDQIVLVIPFFTLVHMVFPALHLAPPFFALTARSLEDVAALSQVTVATVGIVALVELMYYTIMESWVGATVGKLALQVRVVGEDGTSCGLGSAYIRNLMWLVDDVPYVIPCLIGVVEIRKSPKKQRIGDRVARTMVVKKGVPAPRVQLPTVPSKLFCGQCGKEISPEFNVCPFCGAKILRQGDTGNRRDEISVSGEVRGPNVLMGTLAGIAVAILGAIMWAALAIITKWQVGIVASVLGYGVGFGVLKGSRVGGRKVQLIAALLATVAIVLGDYMIYGWIISQEAARYGIYLDPATILYISIFDPELNFVSVLFLSNPVGAMYTILFIALGIYAAYRIPRPKMVNTTPPETALHD